MNPKKIARWLSFVGIALAAFFAVRQIFQLVANRGLDPLVRVVCSGQTGATNLIVVVHAYTGSIQKMADVQKVIEQSRTNAEILMVEYPAGIWSNADCFQIASNLCEKINQCYQTNHYASIEFVGYSMGALLARKAYVYGWGRIEDCSPDPEAPPVRRIGYEWATNGVVKRFVLLAGMNRGWTTRTRPQGMKLSTQIIYTAGKFIGWATGTGRLIRQCERGEPFVANLRMQWLEVVRPMTNRPLVIQLLGDTDDVVSDEDNRDVNVSKGFIFVQLTATKHANATDFHTETVGPLRADKFRQALGNAEDIKRLERASPGVPEEDNTVVEAVVVLHGIRDFGEWTSEFEDALQKRFIQTHPDTEKLCVYRPKYGYFPMGSFLLWPERQKKVRWFMDEITELKAKYPKLKKLHFIGHSNGTYVLASALRKYKSLQIGRAVFAGSVIRKDFNWMSPALSNRVDSVRSYVGSNDRVVGWFPRLFEVAPFTLLNDDLGSAGFSGFTNPPSVPLSKWLNFKTNFIFETRYVEGGHSAVLSLDKLNINSIVAFAMDGDPRPLPAQITRIQPKLTSFLSKFAPLVWAAISCILVLVGMLVARLHRVPMRLLAWYRLKRARSVYWRMRLRKLYFSCERIRISCRLFRLQLKTKAIFLAMYGGLIWYLLEHY